MNIKLITKALHTLSLLSEEDFDLLIKLRGLTESEREALVLVLEPQKPVAVKQERKIEHCAACDYTKRAAVHKDPNASGYHEFQASAGAKKAGKKSPRASSLEQQIKGAARGDNDKRGYLGDGPVCTICSHTEDYEDHSQPSPHYHPFQPPAHPVPKVLRQPYSEQEAYGANSETQPEDASNAVHAGG